MPQTPFNAPLNVNGVQPFADAYAALLTRDVRKANDSHRKALEVLLGRRAARAAAEQAVEQARTADAEAARQAVTDSLTPPTATAPQAEDELDKARRAVLAAEQLATRSQNMMLRAVAADLDALHENVRERQRAVRVEAEQALAALGGSLREADALRHLAGQLDPDFIAGRYVQFTPIVPQRRQDVAEQALAGVRAHLSAPVEPKAAAAA